MVPKLPHGARDFVHQYRVEGALLIFRIERSGRQADLAHGGADIPDHPELRAFFAVLLNPPNFAEKTKKAEMANHPENPPIADPAFTQQKTPPEPHRHDDHPDNEEFTDDE